MNYTGDYTKEISFPLGGIGTGSIGLSGSGRFIDWEIYNRPNKGSLNGYSHFAIKAVKDSKATTYILNGDIQKDLMGQYSKTKFGGYGFGPNSQTLCGFPHFRNTSFKGEFPIAELTFNDRNFPGDITMTAFNPFIPNDEDNSGIPAAFFEIEVKNTSTEDVEYQIALSVENTFTASRNVVETIGNKKFLKLYNSGVSENDTDYGDISIATDCADCYIQTYWYRGRWQDGIVTYWNEFSKPEHLSDRTYDSDGKYDRGTVAATINLKAGESKKVRFIMSWNVPNNYNYWSPCKDESGKDMQWKNYYATLFQSSVHSAAYALQNWDELYRRTLLFKNTLHSSTLPPSVVDAAASNLSVLKSPTALRLEDGSFYGWEGVHEQEGSCEGTCQHVWNYAYALCFLFPKLERSIRDLEFKYSTDENGRMGFRLMLPLGRGITNFRPCVDGQMGSVIKFYREWKISGDNKYLADNWGNIKKILEYAWNENNPDRWDYDKDGVLEGRQHHTLDMELFGPSSWLEGFYLAALKAASEMAEFLGDTEKASEYLHMFECGKEWTKNNLFNGKYFVQKINLKDKALTDSFNASDTYWNSEKNEIKYQIGNGSSIDQLLAQWHANILGLGEIFDSKQVDTALDSMMKYNYKESMRDFANPWRIFSLEDEAGSVICVYPQRAHKPEIPIPYCEETMTGFEYALSGLLCSEGKINEGIKVAKAVRDRFDGKKRNPWNEFECGSNYARSMASYALIPILSGFEFDMPHNHIGFNPYKKDKFNCIWSLDNVWGSIAIDTEKATLSVFEGSVTLQSFGLKFCDSIKSVFADGKAIDFKFENGNVCFDSISISNTLEITL